MYVQLETVFSDINLVLKRRYYVLYFCITNFNWNLNKWDIFKLAGWNVFKIEIRLSRGY